MKTNRFCSFFDLHLLGFELKTHRPGFELEPSRTILIGANFAHFKKGGSVCVCSDQPECAKTSGDEIIIFFPQNDHDHAAP